MAVSEEVRQRLEALKVNIQKFLKLHNNPHDSSVHNELAAKLARIESILCEVNAGNDTSTDTGSGDATNPDMGGGMGSDDTSTGTDMGGDDAATDTGGGDASSLESLKESLETVRAEARTALSTVADMNASQVPIEADAKQKIEAYVAKADEFLQAHQSADEATKNAFDSANSDYANEIQQSRDWNADNFLPRTVDPSAATDSGAGSDSDNSTDTSNLARSIGGSVGSGGANAPADVSTVQGWLNSHGSRLEVNGQSNGALVNEIKKFQRRLGQTRPDGKVDPGKNTWKGLLGEIPVGPPSTAVSSIIQGGESGAAGYNAYNRGTQGNRIVGPNGPRKLVEMTLATIMTNQKRPRNHADYLFAVGKYQMIPDTLAEGVASLRLNTSLKYDENTQELLFSGYLMDNKRPQISAYIKELPGNSAFKAGLAGAQEWASIAVPAGHAKAGRSFYDGVGGNSAHITAEDFLGALNEARASYKQYISQGMSDDDAYRAAVSGVEGAANSGGGSTGSDTGGDSNTGGSTGGSITGSVGAGGQNSEADVRIVQELLNAKGASLTVDGKNGNNTVNAIKAFQTSIGQNNPDGRVDPGKGTWQALSSGGSNTDTGGGTGTGDDTSTDTGGGTGTGDDTSTDTGGDTGTGDDTSTDTGGDTGTLSLSASVGEGGSNQEADVKTVQGLLNKKGADLDVDGKIGNQTISAIRSFQSSINIPPDGLISPDKNTWKGLLGTGGSVSSGGSTGGSTGPDNSLDQGGSDFSHPNHANIRLSYGPRAVKLNARAEKLLKSILAACNIPSGHLTSTLRTYHDQARITKTQTLPNSGAATVAQWYGQPVVDATRRLSIADLAVWWKNYDQQRGRVSSKHLSNIAMDVVPANSRSRFAAKVQELAAASGTNVKRIIPKGVMNEPVDHVEFMFEVTNQSS